MGLFPWMEDDLEFSNETNFNYLSALSFCRIRNKYNSRSGFGKTSGSNRFWIHNNTYMEEEEEMHEQ